MKIFFPIIVTIIGISFGACNNNEPCDYDIQKIDAQITSIEPYQEADYPKGFKKKDTLYHVVMDFNASSLVAEDQYLEKLKGVNIDKGFIARNKLKVGNIYKGMVSERTAGNCEPLYVSFDAGLSR